MSLRRFALFAAALLLAGAGTLQAQDSDIIRGRVVGPDSTPLENANVVATSVSLQQSRSVRTDRNGRYTIIFNGGGGNYMMTFQAIGFQPQTRQLIREADEAVLVADATLGRTPVMLNAITVRADRTRVDRNDENRAAGVGSNDRTVETGNIGIGELGDLAAMAASLPGVEYIPSADGGMAGFSVLGLGAEQNMMTLNGLEMGSGDIPRDALGSTRVSTNSFNPAAGGFSGGQVTTRTRSGTNWLERSLNTTIDAPQFQWTDAAGRALGTPATNIQVSGRQAGPIKLDRLFYATSFQAGRQVQDLSTLLSLEPLALQNVGIAPDSVARFFQILEAQGIPTTFNSIPSARQTDNFSALSQFDFATSGTSSFAVTANGSWRRAQAQGGGTNTIPSHLGDNTNWSGGLSGRFSTYFGDGFLNESNTGFTYSRSESDGYLALPDARVRITSTLDDGSTSTQTLSFGGNSQFPRTSSTFNWQGTNSTSWISMNNKHRFQLTGDMRYSQYSADQSSNRLGTYVYNSLSDFENDIPASFSRILQPRVREGNDVRLAFSLSDSYSRTQRLQFQYGVRADVSQFRVKPRFNEEISELFGVRNDAVPTGVYLSPRLGFSWRYGTNTQVQGFQNAARGSRGTLSGGIGLFQSTPGANLITSAVEQTGLANSIQQLSCIGAAAPGADWETYLDNLGLIPESCTDGTNGTVFSSSTPNVVLFDDGYVPPRSWRANLNWNSPILSNRFRASLGVTSSLNLNQQGWVDLNFDRTSPDFALPFEGNRPVFVAPTSIVERTGSVASRDARLTQEYSRVQSYRSDLESQSNQLQVGISPIRFNSAFRWNATYVLQSVRDLSRGFSGTTAGDPWDTQWARSSADSRHQFNLSLNYTLRNAVTFNVSGRASSGRPYTPMIQGDINGDGSGNDRAFIFDPAAIGAVDAEFATAMQNLLATAPDAARECLQSQMGGIAGRNSCQGPWTYTMNANISLDSRALKLPQRATIRLGLANPLTGIDALVHGGELSGWGQNPQIDPTLFYVRGFDQATQRFKYEVNQRFGATNPNRNTSRNPFRVTLQVQMNVGPDREMQQLDLTLRQGRGREGNRLNEQQLRQRYSNVVQNPFQQLLRQADTLKLTDDQADSIATLNRVFTRYSDSTWAPVVKHLAALPDKYEIDEAYGMVKTAQKAVMERLAQLGPEARKILTSEQLNKLPPILAGLMDPNTIRNLQPGNASGRGRMGGGN